MASKAQAAKRFVQIINQQLEILKEESNSVKDGIDEFMNGAQKEVDSWVNGGHVNQTTCAEMSNQIQQNISFLIAKSAELSEQQTNGINQNQASPRTPIASKSGKVQTDTKRCSEEAVDESGISAGEKTSHVLAMRLAVLEEALFSLKKTTEQVQQKQEHLDKVLKVVSAQQENVNKKMEILSESNLKSQNKLQEKIKESETISQTIASNVDHLKETVKQHDVMLNGLADANKSVNTSIREMSKQINSVSNHSNRTSMSIQDLSKSVESTNQNYNEMSNKMNKLENSTNLMSSHYTKQFENMGSLNKDQVDDLIGMVCQLLAKRLTPLESLNKRLNLENIKKMKQELSKKESIGTRVEEISKKLTQIELKLTQPNAGFYAWKSLHVTEEDFDIQWFDSVECNYGNDFDPQTGIFTAPVNGLYLISISIGSPVDFDQFVVTCNLRSNKGPINLCDVSGNRTITRCTEMKAVETIYLKLMLNKNDDIWIWVHFSCCLIQSLR
ncbi:unnamed protein product [Lymnaea stagnalis]|uniref:C1q domain-containing protein n=1 Tax=Lymnaea stagnalis TaxID=6523 RepID=A0AAV2HVC1_LYMST